MSTPLDRPFDRDRSSPYAPRWANTGASERDDVARPVRLADGLAARETPVYDAPADQGRTHDPEQGPEQDLSPGLVIERFRVPRSLEPTAAPEPWSEPRNGSAFATWARLVAAIATAAVVALFVVGKLSPGSKPDRVAEAAAAPAPTRSLSAGAMADQAAVPAPHLLVVAGAPRLVDDLNPLGVSLQDAGPGASVVVSGLPPGASITTGQPLDSSSWRLSAGDLGNALVRPPRSFVGAVDLVAELRRFDDAATDRKSLRLEWIAAPAPAAAAAPTRPVTREPSGTVSRQLDADEIALLIKRGEEFVANGDLAAARLMLQRAAEAQDAHAAFTLGATYDPVALAQLGIRGLAGDAAAARAWYEKAKQLGSAEASRRLELLASSNR
jgi:hypothetical protein